MKNLNTISILLALFTTISCNTTSTDSPSREFADISSKTLTDSPLSTPANSSSNVSTELPKEEPKESLPSTSLAAATSTENGEVIWVGRGCDYFIIEAGTWYVLAETYGGYVTTGDRIEGKLTSYGLKDFKKNKSSSIRLYIENYWGSKERCFDWLKSRKKCGFQ